MVSYFKSKFTYREILIILLTFSALVGIAISYASVYLFHIVLLISLVSVPFISTKQEIWEVVKKLKYLILLYLFYLVSLSWTLDRAKGVKYFIIMCIGGSLIFLYPLLVKSKKDLLLSLKTGGVVCVLQIVIGLLEHFTTFRWLISKYSIYNHWFGISHIEDAIIMGSSRCMSMPSAFSWGPNDYGVMMCFFLAFVLFFKINKWLKLIGTILLLLNIYFTLSSSVLLGALLMCAIFVCLNTKNKFAITFLILICTYGVTLNAEINSKIIESQLFFSKIIKKDFYPELTFMQ